jgi:hypothetical protein
MIEEALSSHYCVLSVIGPHAGEGIQEIFSRKIEDITRVGRTYWLFRSPKATPAMVQRVGRCIGDAGFVYAVFIEPSSRGGSRPTLNDQKATAFSADGLFWDDLPDGLSPVTGKLNPRPHALVMDKIEIYNETMQIDLWGYADSHYTGVPIRLMLGCSTVAVSKNDMSAHPDRIKSRFRNIVGVARLAEPYCGFVR